MMLFCCANLTAAPCLSASARNGWVFDAILPSLLPREGLRNCRLETRRIMRPPRPRPPQSTANPRVTRTSVLAHLCENLMSHAEDSEILREGCNSEHMDSTHYAPPPLPSFALASPARPAPSPAQPSPAQPSPAQPSPAQPSPAQPPAQPSPAQPSPAQPSPAQPSPAQPAQPSPAQPSPAQPSPAQPAQPSPTQSRAAQPSPAQPQPSPAQPSPAQPSPAPSSPAAHPQTQSMVPKKKLSPKTFRSKRFGQNFRSKLSVKTLLAPKPLTISINLNPNPKP